MQINIRTSEANQEIVRKLTSKLPVGTKENVIARIALGYSLQNGNISHHRNLIYTIPKEKNTKTIFCLMQNTGIFS